MVLQIELPDDVTESLTSRWGDLPRHVLESLAIEAYNEGTLTEGFCHPDDLVAEPFTMKDGFYKVPTKPGLGITLDETAVDRYRVG